ncbi:type II toxin-antitoxin system VapC family toxin [Pararhizobium sp.]|uniref:type II toxin-antitoxin system VapC family toxin n=1 Tax=Pararhizobium sp. TaxID=1977563 RepID=UPI002717618B|nr:type II toxin-antitoxin system VapC family toxin [Pararhizobium sp.]MDO9415806.1 type II toxin-antitoxin system VapC family toxin [Pararhizobium sp.]
MSLILDSSATLAFLLDDERTPAISALFDTVVQNGAVVPSLWYLEVANSLTVAVRRKRIPAVARDQLLLHLKRIDIATDEETHVHAWTATVKIADLYGLSIYDAAYLELAQRRRLPLATLDTALTNAARQSGVIVLPIKATSRR